MNITDFFSSQVKLDSFQTNFIDDAFERIEYPKNKIILEPQNNSKKLIFIEKGLLRTFYFKDTKNITQQFFDENSFVGPIDSIFYNRLDPYGWETLEPTTIRSIDFNVFSGIIENTPGMDKFTTGFLVEVIKTFSERLSALQFQSAQQRYDHMTINHPNIIYRAPLGNIASYLGVTQQTLSVLRGRR